MAKNLTIELNNLSVSEKIELLRLLELKEKQECEDSYFEFFKSAWKILEPSEKLVIAPYIEFLCYEIQTYVEYLIRGEKVPIDTLIINIPPSTSKSSIITKFLNPWIWIKNPSVRICNSSYSSSLSYQHCVNSRDLIISDWYQSNWGDRFQLKYDQNTKSNFANDKTGLRIATSTGAGITGKHFHLFIQDDPINPGQTASEPAIEKAISYNDTTIPSRILDNGFQIIVMQRLHESDPSGHELKKSTKTIKHICLPAEDNDNVYPEELKKLYTDGLLNPDRLPTEKLLKFKEDLGGYAYSGQYEQNPVPQGGGIIKNEWFQYCENKELPSRLRSEMWIDGAYTKNQSNDPTGIMICAYDSVDKKLYVIHYQASYMEMPELLKTIPELANLYNIGSGRIYIEPKASGKSLIQMLNSQTNYSAVEIKGHLVSEGKVARIQEAAPKYEAGKIVHVKGMWNSKFESELTGFPKAKHDEAVDLIGYSCGRYFQTGQGIKRRN